MSLSNNKLRSNQDIVPVIDTDVFVGHEDQRFALGSFSMDDVSSYEPNSVEQAYLKLRANVYIDQMKFLDSQVKRFDGTEIDKDDERSTHFVVLENMMGRAAVFACMRLIMKTDSGGQQLPIEEFFPEAFNDPAPSSSTEVSRLIVRHNERKYASAAKRSLIAAGLAHCFDNGLEPIMGVIEATLERDLRFMKLPNKRIAEPKLLPEYNSENIGVEIDKEGARSLLGATAVSGMSMPFGSYVYWGKMNSVSYLEEVYGKLQG